MHIVDQIGVGSYYIKPTTLMAYFHFDILSHLIMQFIVATSDWFHSSRLNDVNSIMHVSVLNSTLAVKTNNQN